LGSKVNEKTGGKRGLKLGGIEENQNENIKMKNDHEK